LNEVTGSGIINIKCQDIISLLSFVINIMSKGIINDIIENNDGKSVVEVESFADIEKLKEYKDQKKDVRIIMHLKNCIDPYRELVKAMTDLLGDPQKIGLIGFKKEAKN